MNNQLVTTTQADQEKRARVFAIKAIDNAPRLLASSKKQYKRAITNYLDDGGHLLNAKELRAYNAKCNGTQWAFLKAALGKLFYSLESDILDSWHDEITDDEIRTLEIQSKKVFLLEPYAKGSPIIYCWRPDESRSRGD